MYHHDSLPDVADHLGRIQTAHRGFNHPTVPDLVVTHPELLSGIEIETQSPDGSQEDTDTDTDTTESPGEDS
jgi:hypothetical protein